MYHFTLFCVIVFATCACAQMSPDFPSKVLVQAVAQSTKSNVVVSPYSLIAPLGTLSLASTCSTRGEIFDVLGVENKTELVDAYEDYKKTLAKLENIKLVSANKIYIANGFKINHRFNRLVRNIFGVEVTNIDFSDAAAAKAEIAEWVRNKTNKNLLYWRVKPTILHRAVIVNAMYLNAPWAENFAFIGAKEFHLNENTTKQANFMNNVITARHTYAEDLHAEVFQIPYEADCSFMGVLPYVTNSIDNVLRTLALDGNVINEVLDTQMSYKNVNLTIPLFDVLSIINLKELLQNLGVQKLFKNAQLNLLLEDKKLMYVNEAFQKIVMSVNLRGTAAATGTIPEVNAALHSYVLSNVDVLVDRPFYFEIQCSDITLINGVIRNPMTILKYAKLLSLKKQIN